MANQLWLDKVQHQLTQKGLPPSYIRRFMDELADHLEDLKEEMMNKNKTKNQTQKSLARLGKPNQIAEATAIAYRQRTFFGRHPVAKFLVFGVSPMPMMVLAFWGIQLCLALFALTCEQFGADLVKVQHYLELYPSLLIFGESIFSILLPAMLLTMLYCRWAKRSNLSKRWILSFCSILAFIAMMLFYDVNVITPGNSQWIIGIRYPANHLLQYFQMIGPLLIGLWFLLQIRKEPNDKEKSLQAAA